MEELAKESGNTDVINLSERLQKLIKTDNSGRRLLDSFEKLKSPELQEHIELVKTGFAERKHVHLQRKNILAAIWQKVSPTTGLSLYKIFWIFFISSIAGYVVETLYCLVTNGYIESRQGMIYGPFSQVYGFGGVIMVIFLNRLAEKNDRWIFLGSALIGGVYEALCSLIQEGLFGTVSWDYTQQQLAFFNGRTSLLYMFFWGILGIVLIKEIYPRLSRFVDRIPRKQGLTISWVLTIFLTFNMLISAVAVHRWSERVNNIAPENALDVFLDEQYPDDFWRTFTPI